MKFLGAVGLALGLLLVASSASARDQDDARFVGVNRVWTSFEIVTTTLTAYSSCSSQAGTVNCAGRRKRSVPFKTIDGDMADKTTDELDSALESIVKTDGTSDDKSEKLLFTFWSTSQVKTTLTHTSTNTATTVSISYQCKIDASDRVVYPPACSG